MKRVALAMSLLAVVACGAGPRSTPTPLRAAAASGDAAEVRRLLAAHADPNGAESPGWTPLGIAARRGGVEVVQALLAAGADPGRRDDSGNHWRPLIHAVHKHQNAAVRALLDGGAKVDETMAGGATALMFAAAYGKADVVRELLAGGAEPYREMPGGMTALSNAVGGGALFDVTDGPHLGTCFPEVVRLLKERAPDQKLRRTFFNRVALWARQQARLRRPGGLHGRPSGCGAARGASLELGGAVVAPPDPRPRVGSESRRTSLSWGVL